MRGGEKLPLFKSLQFAGKTFKREIKGRGERESVCVFEREKEGIKRHKSKMFILNFYPTPNTVSSKRKS